MSLATMDPNPVWDADAHADTVEILRQFDDATFRVWGGDWCKDCRAQLPDFGAALDAAGIRDENVHEYAVEKAEDGSKVGPLVEEYGIDYIPTVVVERDGEELARFVESEPEPIATYLAQELVGQVQS